VGLGFNLVLHFSALCFFSSGTGSRVCILFKYGNMVYRCNGGTGQNDQLIALYIRGRSRSLFVAGFDGAWLKFLLGSFCCYFPPL
jgi:hypothetical protein